MNISQLKYFLAVYDSGSYVSAAKSSFASRQTLGRAVADLEGELGQKLFEREGRGIRPTDFGVEASEVVRGILADADKLYALAQGRDNVAEGRDFLLAVLHPTPRQSIIDVPSFEEFLREGNNANIRVQYLWGYECEAAVLNEIVDAALTIGYDEDPRLNYSYVSKENAYVVMSRDNELAKKDTLQLEDLTRLPLLQPENLGFFFPRVKLLCETYGYKVDWRYLDGPDPITPFLHSGGGVFASAHSALLAEDPELVAVPMAEEAKLTFPYYYVTLRKHGQSSGRSAMKRVFEYFNKES